MGVYLKSLFYLLGSTALGFGLFYALAPSEAQQEEMRKKYGKQNSPYADVLKSAAASSEPIYRQSPKQIRETLDKATRN